MAASNVVVILPDNRRITIKTTPAMTLKQVAVQAFEKGKLEGNPDDFGLKHGKNSMDLSLTIRFSNLSPGAKLDLVQTKSTTASSNPNRKVAMANIALQLDQDRFTAQFPSNTTLWQILLHFEHEIGKPLTKRLEGEVYQQPIIVYLTNEFSTIPILRSTNLTSMGLGTGSAVLRLNFKPTPFVEVESQLQESSSDVLPEAGQIPEKPQPKPEVEKKVVSSTESIQPVVKEVVAIPVADRQIRVLKPSSGDASNMISNLPDDFYELTTGELKYLLSSQKRQTDALTNRPLMTQQLRDEEQRKAKQARSERFPKTLIRVRFPDMTLLEAQFASQEPLRNLYQLVRESLQDATKKFQLYVAPPHRTLEDGSMTLNAADLTPAAIVNVSFPDGDGALSNTLLEKMQELTIPQAPVVESKEIPKETVTNNVESNVEKKEEAKKAGLPKWLKLTKK